MCIITWLIFGMVKGALTLPCTAKVISHSGIKNLHYCLVFQLIKCQACCISFSEFHFKISIIGFCLQSIDELHNNEVPGTQLLLGTHSKPDFCNRVLKEKMPLSFSQHLFHYLSCKKIKVMSHKFVGSGQIRQRQTISSISKSSQELQQSQTPKTKTHCSRSLFFLLFLFFVMHLLRIPHLLQQIKARTLTHLFENGQKSFFG